MPVFIERFLLAAMAAAFIAVLFVNPLKFDKTQRTTAALALFFGAAFFAQTLYRHTQTSKAPAPNPATMPTPMAAEGKAKDGYELIGTIYGVGMGIPDSQPKDTSVFLIANVRNAGAPTIASDWALQVTAPGGKVINGRNRFINPDHPLIFSRNAGEPMRLSPQDALYMKASSAPIPSGGQVTGVLIFDLVNTKQQDVGQVGTVIVLSFIDVTGKKYSASYTLTNIGDEGLRYYPGMKPPLKPPAEKSKRRK